MIADSTRLFGDWSISTDQTLDYLFKVTQRTGIGFVDLNALLFIVIVKKWQTAGKMRSDIDPEMIMAIFSALINVDTHKEEIGLRYFPQVLEYLAEFTMKGLMD